MTAAARKSTPAAAPAFDITALAAKVTPAKALPPVVRQSTAASPWTALIQKSHAEKVPMQTPAVPADKVKTVRAAIRRAAKRLDLGVSLRDVPAADGKTVVIVFQAKTRTVRKSA